jgi:flagellar M-ring protein FliF
MEKQLQSMLEYVYGAGRALVRVKSDMSFDNEDETLEVFTPAAPQGLVRSSKTEEETSGSSTNSGGVTGVTGSGANGTLPSYTTPESTSTGNNYVRRSADIQYEVNRTERHRVVAPGRVLGLSVAVWIDGNLSTPEKDQVRNTVLAAISGSARRSDVVTVESMPFRARLDQEQQAVANAQGTLPSKIPLNMYVLIGAGALLGMLLTGGLTFMRRRRSLPKIDVMLPEIAATAETDIASAPVAPLDDVTRKRKEIEKLAKDQPSDFAGIVRGWLAEEQ